MNVELITANYTNGDAVRVTTKDGRVFEGTYVSVNSKGINVKVDGKVKSATLKSLSAVEKPGAEDGYTTAALAAIFDTQAKALRVVLRSLGLGVGKGRRYNLDLTEDLKAKIRDGLAA
jgi:hypothetical protein